MRPLDPRLLRWAASTRRFLLVIVALGVITAVLVIVQARLITDVVVGSFQRGLGIADLRSALTTLVIVILLRALVVWGGEWAAARAGAQAKSELRSAVLSAVLVDGAGSRGKVVDPDPVATASLLTRGVDALDGYYARYLPQLVLAVIVPIAILAVVVGQDVLSAVVIAVTLPLIPVFMVLVGMYTRGRVDQQWEALNRLGGQFLDFVAGLPTLMVFGRAKAQGKALREGGERYRSMTMGVLRISFLSSLVLELLAAVAVALVAVEIGLRLVSGGLTLSVGLFVLILAPEAYLPLRLVGTHYHAAAEGLGAADEVFALLEEQPTLQGAVDNAAPVMVELVGAQVALREVEVVHPGRTVASLAPLTLAIPAGRVLAVVGESGSGKTTLLNVLAREYPWSSGSVEVVEADGRTTSLDAIDPLAWSRQVVLVEQQPHLVDPADLANTAPSVRAVVAAADPLASDERIRAALDAVSLSEALAEKSDPFGARTSANALSAGQQRRVALARADLRDASLVLLDEPTAAVDPATERCLVAMIQRWREEGRTVVVVAHRPAVLDVADAVVRLGAPASRIAESSPGATLSGDAPVEVPATSRDVLGVGW